jgi:hypothetical protein
MHATVRGAFVVAIEYRGADLDRHGAASRIGVLEHAYDVETAALAAHHDRPPRIGFPEPSRGWGSVSSCPRCAECQAVVDELVATYVRTILRRHRPVRSNRY